MITIAFERLIICVLGPGIRLFGIFINFVVFFSFLSLPTASYFVHMCAGIDGVRMNYRVQQSARMSLTINNCDANTFVLMRSIAFYSRCLASNSKSTENKTYLSLHVRPKLVE